MHTIPPYQPGVTLRHRDGATHNYPSLPAALKALGYSWLRSNLASDYRTRYYCEYRMYRVTRDWVMVNDFGAPVTLEDFEPYRDPPRSSYWDRRWDGYTGEGPVPGTGRRHGGHMFRRIHSINERRIADLVVAEDGEPPPRAKRVAANLPNAWDDYGIASREDRSWKLHRKTRWKA